MAISSLLAQAQKPLPKDFFGLTFEQKYTVEDIKNHLEGYGTFIRETGAFEMGETTYNGYSFSDVKYMGRTYPLMTIMTLPHGTFGGTTFSYTEDNITDGQPLDEIYDELKNELTERYVGLVDFPIEGHPEISRMLNMNNGVILRLDKYVNDGKISLVELSYLSMTAAMTDAYNAMYPTIQDTFMGLKMGSKQTPNSIKAAVGYKGKFLNEKYDVYGKNIIFTDISFAGRTWDYGNFALTDNGEFYYISIYDSLDDGYLYSDERREADNTYNIYKSKLDKKYGFHEETEDDNGKAVIYMGGNDMGIILSNTRSQSSGGEYRRYVKLEYLKSDIYDRLQKKSSDEL